MISARHAPLLLVLLLGCASPIEPVTQGSDSRAPASPDGIALPLLVHFYPLALGNRWDYDRTFQVQEFPAGGPPSAVISASTKLETVQDCLEKIGEHDYVVEHTVESGGPSGDLHSWVRYRQDRDGLHAADVPLQDPSVCDEGTVKTATVPIEAIVLERAEQGASKRDAISREALRVALADLGRKLAAIRSISSLGPTVKELLTLEYPLAPGATWKIREDPVFAAEDEAIEALSYPPGTFVAHRIRIRSELFGDGDVVHVWYGHAGFLKLEAHVESDLVDIEGNYLGKVVTENRVDLTDLAIWNRPGVF